MYISGQYLLCVHNMYIRSVPNMYIWSVPKKEYLQMAVVGGFHKEELEKV